MRLSSISSNLTRGGDGTRLNGAHTRGIHTHTHTHTHHSSERHAQSPTVLESRADEAGGPAVLQLLRRESGDDMPESL